MTSNSTISARPSMVWLLLGLLLNAVGLYIGFDSALSFVLIIVGWFCCAFGLALLALRRMEKPKSRENTRLSSNFISTGSSAAMPAMREEECNPENPAP